MWLDARRLDADPHELELLLRDDVRLGHVDYLASSRRYVLNGKLDPKVRQALLDLEL